MPTAQQKMALATPSVVPSVRPSLFRRRSFWLPLAGWTALAVLLVVYGPLFVAMPLWPDVTCYDLCARTVLAGGALYRDAFDNNFPGIVWLQAAIRFVVGWSSEAIRLVDLGFVAIIVWQLTGWLRQLGRSPAVRAWTAFGLFAIYLSTTEWCHGQRDTWMLVPALAAAALRRRQVAGMGLTGSGWRVAGYSLLEGICWGLALWIKPFVVVPALLCWGVGVAAVVQNRPRPWGQVSRDTAALLLGGVLAGGAGFALLWRTGALPDFLDISLHWNREYRPDYSLSSIVTRAALGLSRNWPYGLMHLVALPLAIRFVFLGVRSPRAGEPEVGIAERRCRALLAAFYLGWLVQAVVLQRAFDYHLVAPLFLALTLLAGTTPAAAGVRMAPLLGAAVGAGLVIWAAWLHPVFRLERDALWVRCLCEGSSPEVRDQLTLSLNRGWEDRQRVADYLAVRGVSDGELTCWSVTTAPLYHDLAIRPSTRFCGCDVMVTAYPEHREVIRQELAASRQRLIVTDLGLISTTVGLSPAETARLMEDQSLGHPAQLPPRYKGRFPYSEPIVFRAGRFCVHEVTGPVGPLCAD